MPLKPPPRDISGNVLPHDHEDIIDADVVIRRISIEQTVPGAAGRRRISSIAYQPSDGPNGGMSVDLERSILDAGTDPVAHVTTPRWLGSVRFGAGSLRAEELSVGYDPIGGDEPNLHHGQVWGDFPRAKKRRLAAIAQWYVPIPDVDLA